MKNLKFLQGKKKCDNVKGFVWEKGSQVGGEPATTQPNPLQPKQSKNSKVK